MFRVVTLILAEAASIVDAAIAKARQLDLNVSVAVCDENGRLIAFKRMIISPSRGIKTVHDLVSAAKAKSFTFASAGVGTNTHLSAERFRLRAGFEAVHVPFKGGAEAITEVMAGRVDFAFLPIESCRISARAGSRPLR